MDPLTVLTAGAATTEIMSSIKGPLGKTLRRIRYLGKVDPKWFSLDHGMDLTTEDFRAVETFLASAEAAPILRFLTVARLSPKTSDFATIVPTLEKAFHDVIAKWNAGRPRLKIEKGTADSVWKRLDEIYTVEFAAISANENLAGEVASYEDFLSRPISEKSEKGASAQFAKRLLNLAENLNLLLTASDRSAQLADAIKSAGKLPIIEHIDSARSLGFDSLYVQRTFALPNASRRFPSEAIATGLTPFRLVVVGPPGAGKSTFVKHLQGRLLDGSEVAAPVPCFIVSCLSYSRDNWEVPLQESMLGQIRAEFSFPELSLTELDAMLTTGTFVTIFDGLDEITDTAQRSAMARRINSFASRYPAASVLVTSRVVGYENASLDERKFQLVELLEFDENQLEEYVQRWFKLAGTENLGPAFLSESKPLDVRGNPLLLSLLCNLYHSIGEIPANRREIYHECAQLLFKTWDAHRRIFHPHAMPKYRDQLMREIARWFHASSTAQHGVEEQIMKKELANYMHDRVGLTREEATEQADDFLEFCAGRAWLLTTTGTRNGQRVFGFTHRTFLEFFAAEAIVRRENEPSQVAAAIMKEDQVRGTLVPELLLQSYDTVRDGGATEAFVELFSRRQNPPAPTRLLMRLLDGAIIATYGLDKCFDEVISRWAKKDQPGALEDFRALLRINVIARQRFLVVLAEPTRQDARFHFFQFWSSMIMGELAESTVVWWLEPVEAVAREFATELREQSHDSINQWAAAFDIYQSPQEPLSNSLAYATGRFGDGDGFLARFIKIGMPNHVHLIAPFSDLHAKVLSHEPFSHISLEIWIESEPFDLSQGPPSTPHTEVQELACDLLSVALLAAYEAEVLDMEGLDDAASWCNHDIVHLAQSRQDKVSDLSQPDKIEDELEEGHRTTSQLLEAWSRGTVYLAGNY